MLLSLLLTFFVGAQVTEMIPLIEQLRISNFKNYPYLYSGTIENEAQHSEIYRNNEEAIVVQATVNQEIQALVMGTPVSTLATIFPDIESLLKSENFNPQEFYYLEEAILVNDINTMQKVCAVIEEHARTLHYKHICFVNVAEEPSVLKPENYQSLNPLFEQLGFVKTELTIPVSWPTLCGDSIVETKEHSLILWIKALNPLELKS